MLKDFFTKKYFSFYAAPLVMALMTYTTSTHRKEKVQKNLLK